MTTPQHRKHMKERGAQPARSVPPEKTREKEDLGRKKQLQGKPGNTSRRALSHVPQGVQPHFGRDPLYSCTRYYLSSDEVLNGYCSLPIHLFLTAVFLRNTPTLDTCPKCFGYDWQPAWPRLGRILHDCLTTTFWSFFMDVFTVRDSRKGDKNLQPKPRIG